jgi:hypothetical protein
MWSPDPSRRIRTVSWGGALRLPAVVALGGLMLAGCSTSYFDQGNATRVLLITGVNAGNVLESDIQISSGATCPDIVPVRVENHGKNPHAPQGRFSDDIVIERYEVHYFRSDGRGVEGVDVPYSISGNMAFEVQAGAGVNVNVEVVRRQAKLEAPLATLLGGGGARIVTMFADVTLHARTTTGEVTNSASGRLQIDFADFADTNTTCPTVTS